MFNFNCVNHIDSHECLKRKWPPSVMDNNDAKVCYNRILLLVIVLTTSRLDNPKTTIDRMIKPIATINPQKYTNTNQLYKEVVNIIERCRLYGKL